MRDPTWPWLAGTALHALGRAEEAVERLREARALAPNAPRLTFELGLRLERTPVVGHWNWSPRTGVAIGVLPEGRAIVRGGIGKFVERIPLNVEAFPTFESRTVTRFDVNGRPLVVDATYSPDVTATDRHELGQIVGSIQFADLAA